MFKDKLRFVKACQKSSGYSCNYFYSDVTYKDIIHILKSCVYGNNVKSLLTPFNDKNMIYIGVSSFIKWKWFKRLHLLVLDCDTPGDLQDTLEDLDGREIQYQVIKSSIGHYWVVCDKIDTLKNHVYLMHEIPGVDREYIKAVQRDKEMILRAFPKAGVMPDFSKVKIKGSSEFCIWIKSFQDYWKTDEMKDFKRRMFIEAI